MREQAWLNMALATAVIIFTVWAAGTLVAYQQKQKDVSRWTASTHDDTNFPLVGQHRTVECRECHLNLVFEGTPMQCEACHWERRQDDRYQLRLGAHCGDCHTPHSWKNVPPNKWNHTVESDFPLEGVHRTLDCVDCHGDSGFIPASVGCLNCHEKDFRDSREPDHAAAGFPTQCLLCHFSSSSWEGAEFLHDFFVLRGQHRQALCSECHVESQFVGLPRDCVSCHLQDFNTTEDPDHQYLGFPIDCVICHGDSALSWNNAEFSHDFFALRGEHKASLCFDCHSDGQFAGLSKECSTCHLSEYQSTDNPDHEKAGFPLDCTICHGSSYRTWERGKFVHETFTLKGRHLEAACSDCHADGVFMGRSSECVSCHLDDYNAAADPNHIQLGLPTDCEACHGDEALSWENANFSHDTFVLKGRHLQAACSDCHVSGSTNISSVCVSCHLSDYQNTTDPDHELLQFSSDCELCHGDQALTWVGVIFDHGSIWPLQGAHSSLSCSQCHVSGTNLPRLCYGCHSDDYNATTSPNHQEVGFPTDCELCHFPAHLLWTQAVFDHQFPITSGKHSRFDCSECHLTANFKEFSCIDCHAHNQTRMNNKHKSVAGYVYASLSCYVCHPDGKE